MKIGLLDDDSHHGFPNLALLKCATWHRRQGDSVEWYIQFEHYDRVYHSKIFTFKPKYPYPINADEVIRGGTGFGAPYSKLPHEIDRFQPDYSMQVGFDGSTAIGFLTRGCIRRCPWCVVPKAEGAVKPYMTVDEIAIDGRDRLFLMDNNILASDYGLSQIERIIDLHLKVDFNQAMDARLVTPEVAKLLARTQWIDYIRFGCDTTAQVNHCEKAMSLIDGAGYRGRYMLYTMLHGDIDECLDRTSRWKHPRFQKRVMVQAQPMLDLQSFVQRIPQWQRDMAHWANRKWIYFSTPFQDFEPRKGFKCKKYLMR